MNTKSFVGFYIGIVTSFLIWFLYIIDGIHNTEELFLFIWVIILGYMPIIIIIHGLDLFGFKTKLDRVLRRILRGD